MIGSGVLLIPGVIDYFFYLDTSSQSSQATSAISLFMLDSRAKIGNYSVFSWSVYFAVIWAVLIASDYLIMMLPVVVLKLVRFVLGRYYVEVVKRKTDYIRLLHGYVAVIVTTIVAMVFRAVSFPNDSTRVFQQILACILAITILLFFEKLFLKIIAVAYHEKAYAERLLQSKYLGSVIDTLWAAKKSIDRAIRGDISPSIKPWWSMLKKNNTGGDGQSTTGTPSKKSGLHLKKSKTSVNEYTPTANNTKISPTGSVESSTEDLMSTNHIPDSASSLDSSKKFFKDSMQFVNVVTEASGVNAIYRQTKGAIKGVTKLIASSTLSDSDIQSKAQAKWVSAEIFKALADSNNVITLKQFIPFFPSEEESKRAFTLLDKDENGSLTMDEILDRIMQYFDDKSALEHGMDDFGTVISKLDTVLMCAVGIVMLLICLSIFDVAVQTYIVTSASLLVSLSFIIGSSAKSIFESVVFIFAYHAYDVGDKVMIDNVIYNVKKLELNMSTFQKLDGQEVYIANPLLMGKTIINFRRSADQSETISCAFPIYTPESKIHEIEHRMRTFLEKNQREYVPKFDIVFDEIPPPADRQNACVTVKFFINHRANWQDFAAKSKRRNKFMREFHKHCTELKIYVKPHDD